MLLSWFIISAVLLFRMSASDRQVTFTCDGNDGESVKGEPGSPGKRGPEGPRGSPGPIGPIGNAVEVDALANIVANLSREVSQLRERLSRVPSKCTT